MEDGVGGGRIDGGRPGIGGSSKGGGGIGWQREGITCEHTMGGVASCCRGIGEREVGGERRRRRPAGHGRKEASAAQGEREEEH
jgi:hypothetical protein